MSEKPRRCVIDLGYRKAEGNFIQYGNGIVYDDSNQPLQRTMAIIEMDDGSVMEVSPSEVRFVGNT